MSRIDALEAEYQSTLEHIQLNMPSMSFDERRRALEIIQELNNKRAVSNFYVFVQILSPFILGQDYEDGPHIRLLCSELQDIVVRMEEGKAQRKQISLPPRSMKTQLSNLFVAWVLGRHPNWKILHVSHTQSLIEDVSGRPIRDLIATFEYQQIFPGTMLKKDSRSAKRWETTKGGVYFCAGVDGKVAGRGANILIGDDMMADHAAKSKTEREKICKSYVGMYRSRLWKQGSELMIGTRWHVSDLLGYLQTLDGTYDKPVKGSLRPWKVISIPAILDERGAELLGLEEGTIYWPGTKELDEYREIERSSPPEEWQALYQQKPVIEEGNIFKKNHFVPWPHSEPPDIEFIICSLDPAFSEKQSADFSAFTIWGVFKRRETIKFGQNAGREINVNHLILLDAKHGRWSFQDLFNEIEEIYDTYPIDVFVVENKASGILLIQELLRRGWPVHGYNPTSDKITRAHSVTPILHSRRVHVPLIKHISDEFMLECLSFPNYSHDDFVDSMTQAILYLRDSFEMSSNQWVAETEQEDDTVYKPNKPTTIWGQLTQSLRS